MPPTSSLSPGPSVPVSVLLYSPFKCREQPSFRVIPVLEIFRYKINSCCPLSYVDRLSGAAILLLHYSTHVNGPVCGLCALSRGMSKTPS